MEQTSILLCDPNEQWRKKIAENLESRDYAVVTAQNGREAQKLISEKDFNVVLIDIELKSFSSLEVIKFIKFNNQQTKIILTLPSEETLNDYFASPKDIEKLGICEYFVKPFSFDHLDKAIVGLFGHEAWRKIKKPISKIGEEEEVFARDDAFTSIKVDQFFCGNASIFDLYIRLSPNKYLKILNAGDFFDTNRMESLKESRNVEYLYFKTQDRVVYVNFMNEIVSRVTQSNKVAPEVKLSFTQNLSEKYIDELYTKGLTRANIEEGHKVCENTFNMIATDDRLGVLLKNFIDYDDSITSHLFLCSLYASIICKNLEWVSKHSTGVILFGTFLHDVGKIKLPKNIRDKKKNELTSSQFEEYKKHPQYGIELLDGVKGINEQIIQTVYQHHELLDGTGFPMGLTKNKIYPLARIVSFANRMADKTVENRCTPFQAIKQMIEERSEIFQYDSDVIRAFLKGFVANIDG